MEDEKTGENMKNLHQKDGQKPSRKKRKLKFLVLPEGWWLEGDLERMEEEESKKAAFLQEGISDMTSGKASLQLTIRKWSSNEIFFRNLCQEIIKKSSEKGRCMSSQEEDLIRMNDKLIQVSCTEINTAEDSNRAD